MLHLHTYEDKNTAEAAAKLITGKKRLASERDSTQVVYNLFGEATWGNLYKLGLYNLPELKGLLDNRTANEPYDTNRHKEIISLLQYPANRFELQIPAHWL